MSSATHYPALHLLPIFFVYGLSFFCLGLVVVLRRTAVSSSDLGGSIWLLAAFGFLHSLSEWADMFLSLGESYWTPRALPLIQTAGLALALASFVMLLEFGVTLTWLRKPGFVWIRTLTRVGSGAFVMFIVAYGISLRDRGVWILNCNVLMRYLLAIPSTSLAAIGFYRLGESAPPAESDNGQIHRGMLTMAAFIVSYGFLAGAIVPRASFFPASILNDESFFDVVGVRVQLLRAACAACLFYQLFSIFAHESARGRKAAAAQARDARVDMGSGNPGQGSQYLNAPVVDCGCLESNARQVQVGADPMISGTRTPTSAVFDEQALRERVDHDDDLLKDLVELFQNDHAALLKKIRYAIQRSDPRTLEAAAHALKAVLVTFAAQPALRAVSRLENMGRERRIDGAQRGYTLLEIEIERLQLALAELTQPKSV